MAMEIGGGGGGGEGKNHGKEKERGGKKTELCFENYVHVYIPRSVQGKSTYNQVTEKTAGMTLFCAITSAYVWMKRKNIKCENGKRSFFEAFASPKWCAHGLHVGTRVTSERRSVNSKMGVFFNCARISSSLQ